jgi:hypothetical protein
MLKLEEHRAKLACANELITNLKKKSSTLEKFTREQLQKFNEY